MSSIPLADRGRRNSGEVRLTHPDLRPILGRVATALDLGRPAEIRFAAEGSAYPILFVPFEAVVPAVEGSQWGVSNGQAGPGYTFVVRDAWGKQAAGWLAPTYHGIEYVVEKFVENPVDAIPFFVLVNLLEIQRGRCLDGDMDDARRRLLDDARACVDRLGSARFDEMLPEAL